MFNISLTKCQSRSKESFLKRVHGRGGSKKIMKRSVSRLSKKRRVSKTYRASLKPEDLIPSKLLVDDNDTEEFNAPVNTPAFTLPLPGNIPTGPLPGFQPLSVLPGGLSNSPLPRLSLPGQPPLPVGSASYWHKIKFY